MDGFNDRNFDCGRNRHKGQMKGLRTEVPSAGVGGCWTTCPGCLCGRYSAAPVSVTSRTPSSRRARRPPPRRPLKGIQCPPGAGSRPLRWYLGQSAHRRVCDTANWPTIKSPWYPIVFTFSVHRFDSTTILNFQSVVSFIIVTKRTLRYQIL